jgi:UDP-N-acetyl-alpha-D-quinovosamine dehydrogenase
VYILITGATGFLGGAVARTLLPNSRFSLMAGVRKAVDLPLCIKHTDVGEINQRTDWFKALEKCEVVIHCAARVHVMDDSSVDPLSEFRSVNTLGTLNFAKQAAQAGVKRFIFISSIKVNGEHTIAGSSFKPNDSYIPIDPYGLSKYEAEVGLREIAKETGMDVVIIRPPLVYGPGVKGNFVNMMQWLNKGIPLPLGAIDNKRSLVSLDNLVDLIATCIDNPNAANETFLVSDDNDVSTTTLLTKLAASLNAPKRLLPIPGAWLMFFAKLLGKQGVAQRLLGSLQVDITKTKSLLDWTPPYTVDESLKKTALFFMK